MFLEWLWLHPRHPLLECEFPSHIGEAVSLGHGISDFRAGLSAFAEQKA